MIIFDIVLIIFFGVGKYNFLSGGENGIGVCGVVICLIGVFSKLNFLFVIIVVIFVVILYFGFVLLMMIRWFVFLIDVKIVFLLSGDKDCGLIIFILSFFFDNCLVVVSVVWICFLIVTIVILEFFCLILVFFNGIV